MNFHLLLFKRVTIWRLFIWPDENQTFANKQHYCLAYKQYGFRTGILVQWLAEFVTWPVQSGAVLTDLPVRKSVLLALVLLSSKWTKQFIQNFIYRCLGGVNINFNRTFEVYDSWKIKFNLHGPCGKVEVSSHEDSASEFCCVGSIFSMKLLGFVSKAMKLLLTELVGQCRNILPLAWMYEKY